MKSRILPLSVLVATLAGNAAAQTYTLTPLPSFAGDGWLAPGEDVSLKLGTGSLERGLTYNSATGNLLLASRDGGVGIFAINGSTGAFVDSENVNSLLSGGTFAGSMIGTGTDGAIYLANLTVSSSTSPFKVYSWASESALFSGTAPTVAYSGDPIGGAGRFGDSLDVFGGGASTRIAVGAGNTALTTDTSFAVIDPGTGTASYVTYAGTAPSQGDFRLGVTFADSDTVIGAQTGASHPFRVVDFAGTAGTLAASPTSTAAGEVLMDYAVVGGIPVLATADINNSTVRVYNMTDPANPELLVSGTSTSGTLAANGNGVGQVKFGTISGNSATIYAMSANQGIQAMTFTVVPEPEEYAMMAAGGLIAFGVWRRLRR
jgi:hypothetical protein